MSEEKEENSENSEFSMDQYESEENVHRARGWLEEDEDFEIEPDPEATKEIDELWTSIYESQEKEQNTSEDTLSESKS